MKKFRYAFRGIAVGVLHKSIAVQFILGFLAICAGLILRLNWIEWLAVILCIAMVITAEMLNTCIEKLCDLYTKEFNPEIRDIKDIAAGAVLAASLASLAIALVILFRHIIGG